MAWLARCPRTSESFRWPLCAARSRGLVLIISLRPPYPDVAEIERGPPACRRPGGASGGTKFAVLPRSIGVMTVTATYEGTEIARSDRTVVVEGNHYFPAEDVLRRDPAAI